jgi:hypothetical protein
VKINLNFGFRYGMIGYFFDARGDGALHIFPLPFISVFIGFAPKETMRQDEKIVVCGVCAHPPESHKAKSDGYERGPEHTLIPKTLWHCVDCDPNERNADHEFVARVVSL